MSNTQFSQSEVQPLKPGFQSDTFLEQQLLTEAVQKMLSRCAVTSLAPEKTPTALAPFENTLQNILQQSCINPERVAHKTLRFPAGENIAQIPDADIALHMLTPPGKNAFELKHPNPKNGDTIVRYEKLTSGQGILFTPSHSRRTTNGFALGVTLNNGFPVPHTMHAMRPEVFLNLAGLALQSHATLMEFPSPARSGTPVHGWAAVRQEIPVSIAMPELTLHKQAAVMDSIVLAPGSLAALPGFGGIAYGFSDLPLNKSGFHSRRAFSGVSHLTLVTMLTDDFSEPAALTKKALGFPERSEATPREISEGMFYSAEQPDELFKVDADGKPIPFKVTLLSPAGDCIITLAFNITYPGVVKKDKKAGISAAVNLRGMALEEHAGATLIQPRKILAATSTVESLIGSEGNSFSEACVLLQDQVTIHRTHGFAQLYINPNIILIPQTAVFSTDTGSVTWKTPENSDVCVELTDTSQFLLPNGDRISTQIQDGILHLIHTSAESLLIRRNNTASAGGKTETAASIITDQFPIIISDLASALTDAADLLITPIKISAEEYRQPLSADLSAELLETRLTHLQNEPEFKHLIYPDSLAIVMTMKLLLPEQALEQDWKTLFSVQHFGDQEILYFADKALNREHVLLGENTHGKSIYAPLRFSVAPAFRIQTEDDVSITTVQPVSSFPGLENSFPDQPFVERAIDTENFHFNRPDEVLRGPGIAPEVEEKLAGQHMGSTSTIRSNILVNWQKQSRADALAELADPESDKYHPALQRVIATVAAGDDAGTYISPRRIIDENIRLMEPAPHIERPEEFALAAISRILSRRSHTTSPAVTHAHMSGEKNTLLAADGPTLAFQGPLYLEFGMRRAISGLTGKSPSITSEGAEPGVEGPLTKNPFNYLPPFADLNTYAVARALCNNFPFTTPSGFIGTDNVGHNMGYLMTETVARMSRSELNPDNLLAEGSIEPLPDLLDSDGATVRGSLLGYRITEQFLSKYVSRIISAPLEHIPARWLRPENTDPEAYIAGVKTVLKTQRKVAEQLITQGADDYAILPVKATLHMMASADGTYRFRPTPQADEVIWVHNSPDYRKLFTPAYMINSEEYQERLRAQQRIDLQRVHKQLDNALNENDTNNISSLQKLAAEIKSDVYIQQLTGTLGADPSIQKFVQ